MKISVKQYQTMQQYSNNHTNNRRKISITNIKTRKTANYVYSNFLKQYYRALEHQKVGEMITCKQMLKVLAYMGFIDDQPNQLDIQLAKTLTYMLSNHATVISCKAVSRGNLLKFLIILCDIQCPHQQQFDNTQQLAGLPADNDFQQNYQPVVIIRIGQFDTHNKWSCTNDEKQQIRQIFCSMKMKRISKNQVQSRKRNCAGSRNTSILQQNTQNKQTFFKPKLNERSLRIAEKKLKTNKSKVQNRLLSSKYDYDRKINDQINKSLQKQLSECTFKPKININNTSKQKTNMHRSSSMCGYIHHNSPQKQNMQNALNKSITNNGQSIDNLLYKGEQYKNRRQKLHQLKIKLDQSVEMSQCTFKPHTTKNISHNSKWVFVRNRQKQIQRLQQGRKQRQFRNSIKSRGYPSGVNWNKYLKQNKSLDKKYPSLNQSMNEQTFLNKSIIQPILCIDLKILENRNTINVYENDQISQITTKVLVKNDIPEKFSWKVQELITQAIEKCQDVQIDNDTVVSKKKPFTKARKLYY